MDGSYIVSKRFETRIKFQLFRALALKQVGKLDKELIAIFAQAI